MVSLNTTCHFKFFKSCYPQVLPNPFLNKLSPWTCSKEVFRVVLMPKQSYCKANFCCFFLILFNSVLLFFVEILTLHILTLHFFCWNEKWSSCKKRWSCCNSSNVFVLSVLFPQYWKDPYAERFFLEKRTAIFWLYLQNCKHLM